MGHLGWVVIHCDWCLYKKNFRNKRTTIPVQTLGKKKEVNLNVEQNFRTMSIKSSLMTINDQILSSDEGQK